MAEKCPEKRTAPFLSLACSWISFCAITKYTSSKVFRQPSTNNAMQCGGLVNTATIRYTQKALSDARPLYFACHIFWIRTWCVHKLSIPVKKKHWSWIQRMRLYQRKMWCSVLGNSTWTIYVRLGGSNLCCHHDATYVTSQNEARRPGQMTAAKPCWWPWVSGSRSRASGWVQASTAVPISQDLLRFAKKPSQKFCC